MSLAFLEQSYTHTIVIESINPDEDISMREVYGLDPKLAQ